MSDFAFVVVYVLLTWAMLCLPMLAFVALLCLTGRKAAGS